MQTYKAVVVIGDRGWTLGSCLFLATAITAVLVSSSVWAFREKLFAIMSSQFEGKQSLSDGMFIAALLDTTNGRVLPGHTYWVHYKNDDEKRLWPHPESDDQKIQKWLQEDQKGHFRQGVVREVHPKMLEVQFGEETLRRNTRDTGRMRLQRRQTVAYPDPEEIPFKSTLDEEAPGAQANAGRPASNVSVQGADDDENDDDMAGGCGWCRCSSASEASQPINPSARRSRGLSGTEMGGMPPPVSNEDRLMKDAVAQLRCVEWKNIQRSLFTVSPRAIPEEKREEHKKKLYALSKEVEKDETGKPKNIDFFVSHSWQDDGHASYTALANVAEEFKKLNHRYPTFWLDAVCFDQDNIANCLKVLPINVMQCDKVLVLGGETYAKRLWCVWELYTIFAFKRQKDAIKMIQLACLDDMEMECDKCKEGNFAGEAKSVVLCQNPNCDVRRHLKCERCPEGIAEDFLADTHKGDWFCEDCKGKPIMVRSNSVTKKPRSSSAASVLTESDGDIKADVPGAKGLRSKMLHLQEIADFKLDEAHTYDPNEEQRIRLIISEGGADVFENHIKELGEKVLQQEEALTAGRSRFGTSQRAASVSSRSGYTSSASSIGGTNPDVLPEAADEDE